MRFLKYKRRDSFNKVWRLLCGSPRSGRKHKAWGASPRIRRKTKMFEPAAAGDSIKPGGASPRIRRTTKCSSPRKTKMFEPAAAGDSIKPGGASPRIRRTTKCSSPRKTKMFEPAAAGDNIKPGAQAPGSDAQQNVRARAAGESIKPGAQAPGSDAQQNVRARETGDSVRDDALPPASRAQLFFIACDPGACAPGFMLSPAARAYNPWPCGLINFRACCWQSGAGSGFLPLGRRLSSPCRGAPTRLPCCLPSKSSKTTTNSTPASASHTSITVSENRAAKTPNGSQTCQPNWASKA